MSSTKIGSVIAAVLYDQNYLLQYLVSSRRSEEIRAFAGVVISEREILFTLMMVTTRGRPVGIMLCIPKCKETATHEMCMKLYRNIKS